MHRRDSPETIRELIRKLEKLETELAPHFHTSGFSHPKLLVFPQHEPFEPRAYQWGLIPHWVKDKQTAVQLSNQTINARIETLFEKPSFRESARERRCLIYLDAFYEHFHLNGNAYPFHIAMKNDDPIALAGIWDEWVDVETGELMKTVSIVTTKANPLLAKIHNNPKAEEARMPFILSKETQDQWLIEYANESTQKALLDLARPYDETQMVAYPVRKLKGKEAIGDVPEAEKEWEYPELAFFF